MSEVNIKGEDAEKQRVVQELEELGEKIVKLTSFLYGTGRASLNLSYEAIGLLHEQLGVMQRYAELLQRRIAIWGKSDEELRKECPCV